MFLNLDTADILDQITLCHGELSCACFSNTTLTLLPLNRFFMDEIIKLSEPVGPQIKSKSISINNSTNGEKIVLLYAANYPNLELNSWSLLALQ